MHLQIAKFNVCQYFPLHGISKPCPSLHFTGDRFYIFLMRFSSHVLRMVTLRLEKSEQIYISSFITSPGDHTPALKEVTKQAMKAHIVRHTQNVVNRMEVTGMLHEEWMKYARLVGSCTRTHTQVMSDVCV